MTTKAAAVRKLATIAKDPAWLLGLLVFFALWITVPVDGSFWWFDSSRHAMNSVFLHDFMAAGAWFDPLAFARDYYAKYPGINIGFYPPGLYVVTSPLMLLFGATHGTAQAVATLSAAALAVGAYALTKPSLGRAGAFALGLIVVIGPEVSLWSRQVQPDVPAVALVMWGTWALVKLTESPQKRWLFLAAVLFGMATLTRLQVLFVWPVWLFVVFVHGEARRVPMKFRISATMLYGLLSAPAVGSAIYFSATVGALARKMPDMPKIDTFANWAWYASHFHTQLGLGGFLLLLTGATALFFKIPSAANRSAWSTRLDRTGIVTAMALAAWVFFSLISNKEPRFGLPILPLALVASALWLGSWNSTWNFGKVAVPLLLAVAIIHAAIYKQWGEVPAVRGHSEAARLAADIAPRNSQIMISAHRDGNFIFALRQAHDRSDLAVRRADKMLVDMKIMRQLGIRDRGFSQGEIRALLEAENISVVVAQESYLGDQPSMQNLQSLLDDSCCFRFVRSIDVTGESRSDEKRLRVYVKR